MTTINDIISFICFATLLFLFSFTFSLFTSFSNFFSIKGKETEVNTNRDLKQSSSTKYKIDDVVDSIPDSAASKSLLF